MVSSRVFSVRSLILSLLLGGSIAWSYLPVFGEMATKWVDNPQYSHAYLVPVFSAYLLWKARNRLSLTESSPVWLGSILLLVAILLRLAGVYLFVSWLEMVSLLPLLWGTALLLGGWSAFRWAWVAIGFLVFMLPLPYRVETAVSGPLQTVATEISTYTLQLAGMPAFREGNVILVGEHRIGIVAACNGLGMLLLFIALSVGMFLLSRRPWLDRTVLLLSAVPIAILSNVARIVLTSVLYNVAGQRWGDLVFHDLSGWLMMPLALGMMFLELKLLSFVFIDVPEETSSRVSSVEIEEHNLEHAQG